MTERHELRWGGLAGLAFVVLALLGRFLPGNPPTVDESANAITTWLTDNRGMILTSGRSNDRRLPSGIFAGNALRFI